ncbi:MAG TPA: ABC transporter permease [Vicinamibacterales bacterium]
MGDFRTGFRLLRKDKSFTLAAVLTLTVCIGANVALFSIVRNVLLKPLALPDSPRIVLMGNAYPGAGSAEPGNSAVPDYYDRLRDMDVFDEQAAYNGGTQSVDQNGVPLRIRVNRVTPSFFRLLRVRPLLGRTFGEEDGQVGRDTTAVISYAFWQSQFGGDATAVGKELRLDGQPVTVIGVMPRDFYFLSPDVLLWRPLAFTPEQRSDEQRHSNNFQNIGRLKSGATITRAQQEVNAINARNLEQFPALKPLLINAGFHTVVEPLQDTLVRDIKSSLYLMWGGALFVLLIGCVNVANLVLVRSRARMRDLATRLALGAGRARLGRQLVIESVLLTLVSAALGLLVGYGALEALSALRLQELPRGTEIRLDAIVVASTFLVALAVGIVIGLIPLAIVLPTTLTAVLREEGRSGTAGRGTQVLRRTLVVAQIGFAFVLLIGAGLLFASFRQVLAIQPGFNPDHVLTASVALPRSRYPDEPALIGFAHEALRRLRALPGVSAVGATNAIPFGANNSNSVILAEGYQMQPGESVISPRRVDVSPGFFEAMGVTLRYGRFFDDRDSTTGPVKTAVGGQRMTARSIVVDETLAKRFWPGQDPVGRRMYFPNDIKDLTAITDNTVFHTVVGVIADIKLRDLTEGQRSVGAYYFSTDQEVPGFLTFAVKTAVEPVTLTNAVRAAVNGLDRELPVFDVQTMQERMERSLVSRRSPVVLSLVFAGVALLLSAFGIYGVLAYLVSQRRREFGIRLALGSSAGSIFELVLREGLLLIGGGLVLGSAGALMLRKSFESQLFAVAPTDPVVLALVTGILALVAAFACVVPASRATRIDPIIALTD